MKRKSKIKSILAWGVLLALAAALAILPAAARQRVEANSAKVLMSAAAKQGRITGTLAGGGTLSAEDMQSITIPSGVEITEYLVEDGQHVTEGTPVASVDPVTVMAAAMEVQETLDTLAEKLTDAANEKGEATLTAIAEGRIKAVYGKSGSDVRETMLTYGCLAVISLDGRMAVEFTTEAALAVGGSVRVRVTGDKTYSGRVESFLEGTAVVTLTDNGPKLGAAAEVTDRDGNVLGSGTLAVHSPLRVIAESGTVNKVLIKMETKVAKGAKLITLKNMEPGSEYESLASKRREYAEVLQELFTLYRDGAVKAPGDGYVIGLDESLVKELSASDRGDYRVVLLDNETPTSIPFFVRGTVESKNIDSCTIAITAIEFSGDIPGIFGNYLTQLLNDLPKTWPQQLIVDTEDKPLSLDKIKVGDECTAYYTASLREGLVPVVTEDKLTVAVQTPQPTPPVGPVPSPSTQPIVSPSPGSGGTGGLPGGGGGTGGLPGGGGTGGLGGLGGLGGFGGKTGGFGGMTGGAAAPAEEEEELYDLTETVVGSLVPDNSMKVSFPVDELDILKYTVGMNAEITVDALPGRSFSGTVTDIGTIGVSGGGNSKFTVTVSFDRTPDMLEGMNASVVVDTGTVDSLLIPAAALHDSGSRTYVYTAVDKESRQPQVPVEVTVGVSDGENAQILSGLTEGQLVWYIYYGVDDDEQNVPAVPIPAS